jgi:hypothetical protein
LSRLDAAVSSRSTYAGGAVASVTAAVTVGTNNDKTGYALSAAGVQAVWDALTSALTTVGSIGKLLVDRIDAAVSSRMATFTYTAPPSAASVATATRTELGTELGRMDAAVSSRLATAGYTAPIAAATIATAVRTELAAELARIDVAVSTRLAAAGYTAPYSAAAIAAATRIELAVELARIDVAISSRSTYAGGAVPVSGDFTQEMKDSLVQEIVNRCTTSGNLIADSNDITTITAAISLGLASFLEEPDDPYRNRIVLIQEAIAALQALSAGTRIIEGDLTHDDVQRILLAEAAGEEAGVPGEVNYMSLDGSKPRISGDANETTGERSNVVLDGSL